MKTIVHKVGNKINGDGIKLSTEELALDEKTHELLENYFLSAFKSDETYLFIVILIWQTILFIHVFQKFLKNQQCS